MQNSFVMKWKMEKSEISDEGNSEELLTPKTRVDNGVASPDLSTFLESEELLSKTRAVNGLVSQKVSALLRNEDIHGSPEVSHKGDLKTLGKVIFAKFNNVTDLNLVGNSLRQLPAELNALHTLQTLNVSCNDIVSISESIFSSLECLKILNLSKNKLIELPVTICNLKNLRIFKVSENNLAYLPQDIGQLRSLEMLDVSMNNLHTLPPSLEHVWKLYTLNVSYNNLEDVPECIVNLKNLVNVNLSHNRLISFNRMLRCCCKLVKLDLSHNFVTVFPSWLFEDHCMWLKELNLSYNHHMEASAKSSSFNTCIKYLRKQLLKSLNISNCKLTVPMLSFLEGLQGMEILDLGNDADRGQHPGNAIWTLPSGQLSLSTRLRKLVICNVGLTEFPEDVKGMMALDVLDLSGNDLSFLPASFCKLKNLRQCMLSRNQLDSLPSQFGLLASLEELWLDGNKLSALPESFASLKRLRVLDLYNNVLYVVPACIKFLSSLQALDLELNFINMEDQGPIETFCENYQELKTNMRQKLPKSCTCRVNGVRLKDLSSASECSADSGEELERVSTSDCSETFHDPVPTTAVMRQDSSERSFWDDESEVDDNFDPNERAVLAVTNVVPLMQVNPLMFPRNFCPMDMHFQGICKRRKLMVTEPVEAQFEDSPFDDTDINPTNISYLLNEKL